ncbi:MAG: carbohydrate ABC transporter substrate-binding protein [Spirochaetales bacterium]|nr:carbohydrate ABC transporter substrate-binding protein [Spirochaetales bacterium]
MKKVILIVFFLIIIIGMAIAGTQLKEGGAIVVKTMAYGSPSNSEGQDWLRIVDAFEMENPNIDIAYELLYGDAYHQKVNARLASGDIPHLAYMGTMGKWSEPWQAAGQQTDLRPYIDANFIDISLIPPMGPNGEIWEIPLGRVEFTSILYMNMALADSYSLTQPVTYDDLLAMVPTAQANGKNVVSIPHSAPNFVENIFFRPVYRTP